MSEVATLVNIELEDDSIRKVSWITLKETDVSWIKSSGHHYSVFEKGMESEAAASLGTIMFALHPHIDKTTAVVMNPEQRDLLMEALDEAALFVPPIFLADDVIPQHIIDQMQMELAEL